MAGCYPLVLINDPKVLSIPIREVNEHLLDIRQYPELAYGPSPEIEDNLYYTFMRYTVYKKLKEAQLRLPAKYRLCLYEGFRHPELQDQLFRAHLLAVKQEYPQFSELDAFNQACKLFSPLYHLDGRLNVPPHSTGAAIDVYLISPEGETWDMGIHPKDWRLDINADLSSTHSELISAQAQKHRQLMSQALHSVGFVNYPTEYWHWSYGDRYWAYTKQRPYALYGGIDSFTLNAQEKSIIRIDEEQ